MGASNVKVEGKDLGERIQAKGVERFDKVLNLVGNSVPVQSISLARPGGRVLQAG